MTVIWLIVWFVADRMGDRAGLRFDPVNAWAGTLLLCAALDLARGHAPRERRRRDG